MADNFNQATVSPPLPASLFGEADLESLSTACGLSFERHGDELYFFAEASFSEDGEDEEGEAVDVLALLQAKLRQLDAATYPHITIQGAFTCSKMRPEEFGGFAHVITRNGVRSLSTGQWLARQTGQWVVPLDPLVACRMVVERWEHGDLAEAARACAEAVATATADALLAAEAHTIRIEVRGGVVQDVSNVPPGWDYDIVDHDDLETENR